MILLVGEASFQDEVKAILKREGYREEGVIVEAHSQAMRPAASRWDLLAWLTDKPALNLSDKIEDLMKKARFAHHEWLARIAHLEESTGGKWFIHDFRPLWWFDYFSSVVGEVKVIPLRSDENDYHQAIGRFFDDRLPGGAMATKVNQPPLPDEIKNFLNRKQKKPIDLSAETEK